MTPIYVGIFLVDNGRGDYEIGMHHMHVGNIISHNIHRLDKWICTVFCASLQELSKAIQETLRQLRL